MERSKATKVMKMYEESAEYSRTLRKSMNDYYNAYRSFRKKGRKGKANLFIPYTFSTIEQLLPKLVLPVKTFTAVPQTDDPELEVQAIKNSRLLQYQYKRAQIDLKCINWIKSSLIYGLGVGKVTWSFQQNREGQIIYDDPFFENVDIMDFYPDPNGIELTMEDSGYAIHKRFMTKKQMKAEGLDVSSLNDSYTSGIENNADKRARSKATGLKMEERKGRFEVIECWIPEDRVVTMLVDGEGKDCDHKVLREIEFPYSHGQLPFVLCTDYPDLHSLYGIGEPETIYSLQMELNDLRNQRSDNINLILNTMWEARKGSQVNPANIVSSPGNIIWVSELGQDVKPFETKDVSSSSYREEGELKSDISLTTAVGDYQRGGGKSGTPETAGAVSAMGEATSSRNQLKSKLFELTGLKRLGEMFFALNHEFVDRERVIRVTGDDGVEWETITPEDVASHFDIEVTISPAPPENQTLAKAQYMELVQVLKDDPDIDQKKLKKVLLEAFNLPANTMLLKAEEAVQQPTPGAPVEPPLEEMPPEIGMPGEGGDMPPMPEEGGGAPMPEGLAGMQGSKGGTPGAVPIQSGLPGNSGGFNLRNVLGRLMGGGRRTPSGGSNIKTSR